LASLEPGRLAAAVEHPRAGPLSGADLVAAWVAHDRLHLRQLTGTLARLWAARWAPLRTDYAGPIPYGPGAGPAGSPQRASRSSPDPARKRGARALRKPFPGEDADDPPAVDPGLRVRAHDQAVALESQVAHLGGARPHLVQGDLDVVRGRLAVEREPP